MNQTLSTFLKLGITALTIAILLFGVAYNMTDREVGEYKTKIESVSKQLPTSSQNN
ncbi:hypothetical protein [Caldibacillus debilis]|uniref:hypothetical protein n=1 Tax=Caldibacillus debilis TaxID=301148 RepID=UPI001365DA09|nr:hypothetical protein [Caldibacillus debilis]